MLAGETSTTRTQPQDLLLQAALSHLELALINVSEQAGRHQFVVDDRIRVAEIAAALHQLAEHSEPIQEKPDVYSYYNSLVENCASPKPATPRTPTIQASDYPQRPSLTNAVQELADCSGLKASTVWDKTVPEERISEWVQTEPDPSAPGTKSSSLALEPTKSRQAASSRSLGGNDDVSDVRGDMLTIMMVAFEDLDSHEDSKLPAAWLRQACEHYGLQRTHVAAVFSHTEKTHDGLIYKEEWHHIAKEIIALHHKTAIAEILRKIAIARGGLGLRASSTAANLDRIKQSMRRYYCILSCHSRTRMIWDILVIGLLAYVGFALPLTFAFEHISWLHTIDQTIDWVFCCDLILNFRTTYMNSRREEIWSSAEIAKRYFKTWFFLDFISSFPFEQVSAGMFPRLQAAKLLKFGKIVKALKMLRIGKIIKLWAGSEVMDLWEEIAWTHGLLTANRGFNLLAKLAVMGHWLACLLIACKGGTFEAYFNDEEASDVQKYLAALYWAMMTMTTVGYGDVAMISDLERLYAVFAMLVGGLLYGYIVGSMATILSEHDLSQRNFTERMEIVVHWLNSHCEISHVLRRRVWKHFREFLSCRKTVEDSIILNDLPPQLCHDVSVVLLKDSVRSCHLFDNMSITSLSKLVPIVQEVKYQADEIVVNEGDLGQAMYIVDRGFVHLSKEGKTRQLCHGDCFGEELLLSDTKIHEYMVKTHSRVTIFKIGRVELLSALKDMPQDLLIMEENFGDLWGGRATNRSLPATVHGAASLIAGGATGITASFPDAVLERFTYLMKKIDTLYESHQKELCQIKRQVTPDSLEEKPSSYCSL